MLRHAIVCHLFYHAHIEKAIACLEESVGIGDIYITCNQALSRYVIRAANKKGLSVQIRVYENIGMDVLPFLKLLPELESSYDVVTKFHIKQEIDDVDAAWNKHASEALVTKNVLLHVEHVFAKQSDVAFAGMAPFYLACRKLMLGNEQKFQHLLKSVPGLAQDWGGYGFFAGTNFSFRPAVLKHLSDWAISNDNLFAESYSDDGAWANAIERIFLLACSALDKVALIFSHESNVFSQICKPTEFVSQASTREVGSALKFITEDSRDLSALLEHSNRSFDDQAFVGTPYYVPYYLFLEQFLLNSKQIEPFRILKHQRNTINWQELKERKREKGKVSIVIPVYNQAELTEACIRSLYQHNTDQILEVIAVDNGSDTLTKNMLARLKNSYSNLVVISLKKNMNFSFGCNLGFDKSNGDYVVFMNNDIEASDGWLSPLVAPVESGNYFASQPLLIYPDSTIQNVGIAFNENSFMGYGIYNGKPHAFANSIENTDFSAITAACICVRALDFAEVEGFSPVYVNGQEDIDLCFKLKKHTSLMAKAVTKSVLVHHESKTEGRFNNVKPNRHIFVKRWASYISPDDLLHYKNDEVVITSTKSDTSNIPFWIKSSSYDVLPKIGVDATSLLGGIYAKHDALNSALSSLMYLIEQNSSLASSFQYTFNDLRQKLNQVKHVTRTIIVAKDAFSEGHVLADYLYDYYKKHKSSVGIALISERHRIVQSSYLNMNQEQKQTDCLYLCSGEIRVASVIQYVLSHRADNIHLVDLSFESLMLAAVYKLIYNSNVYAERMASLRLLPSLRESGKDCLPFFRFIEPVVTKGFESEYVEAALNPTIANVNAYSMFFVYEESNFIEVAWFINYIESFFKSDVQIDVLVFGEMKSSHKMLYLGEQTNLIFMNEQYQAKNFHSNKAIVFKPSKKHISNENISFLKCICESFYLLPTKRCLDNFNIFSQSINSFNRWIEVNNLKQETATFKEQTIEQLRDCKRESYMPLNDNASLRLLQGDILGSLKER